MERSKTIENVCSVHTLQRSITLTAQRTETLRNARSEHCISSCGTHIKSARVGAESSNRNFQQTFLFRNRLPSKALRVRFYRNSNVFFKGFVLPVSRERYRTFDILLEDLTEHFRRHVILTKAISIIVRMGAAGKRGRRISDIGDFIDGDECVCCCKHELYSNVNYVRDDKLRKATVDELEEHSEKTSTDASTECLLMPRQAVVLTASTEDDMSICKRKEMALATTTPKAPKLPEFLRSILSINNLIADNTSTLVYGASHRRNGDKYVLKHIKKYDVHKKNSELTVMILLRGHPNILSVRLTYESPKSVVLLLDFMECDLLSVFNDFGAFSEQNARYMMFMLASGLVYMHGKSIMHRDIKPENVLVNVDEDGNILHLKIADFGLAVEDTGRPLYFRCGTPHYMAPEVINFEGYNRLVDCWSTGALLYNLMCGMRPFGHALDNIEDIYNAIKQNDMIYEPLLSNGASSQCILLIRRLLSKSPKFRLTAAEILNDPFISMTC